MKILHQFDITLTKEVDKVTVTEENGAQVSRTTKVKEPVTTTIVLKEPSRQERRELVLFQGITYNNAISMGFLPRITMAQKIADAPNSPISSSEDKNLVLMNDKLQELANDYIRLKAQPEKTDEIKERMDKLGLEWASLNKKVVDLNTSYQSVFAHTAEQYRDTQVISWMTVYLTYIKNGDKYDPMFAGTTFESKEDALYDLEESNDALYIEAIQKLPTYYMLYYFGRAAKPEDFKVIESQWRQQVEEQEKAKEDKFIEEPKAAEVVPVT